MNVMKTIGDRIRAARQAAGLNQPELAQRVGVSKGMISQWENNASTPKSLNLRRLGKELGVNPDFLLEGQHGVSEPKGDYQTAPAIKEVEKLMIDLPAEDQKHALEILRAFAIGRQAK